MRTWLVLFMLVLVPAVIASQEAEDLFASETVGVEIAVSSNLELVPKRGGAIKVDYVQADLFFYPKEDTSLRLLSLTTEPDAEQRGEALRYRWESPTTTRLRYESTSAVEVYNQFPRVTQRIPFPLTFVTQEVRQYLAPSEHIDSTNTEIINLANKLAQGKDDLFVVVSEIAIWTKNNIAYNLSTLTADVSQKASWVLENKYGVCDELTSLFIALLRALGIPARFVTGVAYTASPLFPQRWGAHGWAEVYFPDVGWVPFDPTFGEFGWVDPGHVKMMTSLDPNQPSVRFEWRGTNANLKFTEPDVNASITSVGKRLPPVVGLSIKSLYEDVGFGSYNLVQATVENLQPYYSTTEIRLARVNELEVLEPMDRQIILKPHEKKNVLWRVKVNPGLQERYVYTIPLGVYTVMNDSAIASFSARTQGSEHTKTEVTRAMNALTEDEQQAVSQNLEMTCTAGKTSLYPGEVTLVNCTLRNLGTTALTAVRVCIEDKSCAALDLGIGQTRELSLPQAFTTPGPTTLFVRATTHELTKSLPIAFAMKDVPAINITGLTHPATVAYDTPFTLVFVLAPVSHTIPKNVHISVSTNIGTRLFEMPELTNDQIFEIEMHANDLSWGETPIRIDVRYEDDHKREYQTTATARIKLTDVPFLAKIWLWVRQLFE